MAQLPIGHPSRPPAGAHVHSWCSEHECYAGSSRRVGPSGQPTLCKLLTVLWRYRCYATDNRPWSGPGHPAAAYAYSEDRKGEHPAAHLKGFRGLLQVDGYAGFGGLVTGAANDAPTLAFCWAHTQRKFYDVYTATKSPLAHEALQRISALYAIEADIRGQAAAQRQ